MGCVLPIGPDFQDAEPLLPPYLVRATPSVGESVTRVEDKDPTFVVTVADPNVNENLYLRVVFNYPPFRQNLSRSRQPVILAPSPRRTEARDSYTFRPNCQNDALPAGVRQHRMLFIVSDRQFLSETDPASLTDQDVFTAVPKDARVATAQWILEMECR